MLKGLCYDDVAALSHEILKFILLNEKFLQSDWLRAVVFQLNFEISLVVFMPNITTNHAFTHTNSLIISGLAHTQKAPVELFNQGTQNHNIF